MMTKKLEGIQKNFPKNLSGISVLETKILLAKAIIKNWDKTTKEEKKDVERWWEDDYKRSSSEAKETYWKDKNHDENKE